MRNEGRYHAERETPVGGIGTVGAVLVLAIGSGVVVFLGAGALVWALGWSVRVAVGVAGAVILWVWVSWVFKVEGLMWSTETVRPEAEAEPAPVLRDVVSVEVSEPAAGRYRFLDVPGGGDALRQLAAGIVSGRTLSEAEWCGSSGPYSRSDFRQLRGVMIERGLMRWRHPGAPSQGVELTDVGLQVFEGIAGAHAHRARARQDGSLVTFGDQVGQGVYDA